MRSRRDSVAVFSGTKIVKRFERWCKLHRFFLLEAMKKAFFLRKSGDSGTLCEVSGFNLSKNAGSFLGNDCW